MPFIDSRTWACPRPRCGVVVRSEVAEGQLIDDHIRSHDGGPHPTWTCPECSRQILSADGPDGEEWSERIHTHRTKDHATATAQPYEAVDHPSHYGGDTAYEVIKVLDAWGLGFALGNAVKYIARAGRKPTADNLEDLRKAKWYIEHEIKRIEESK